MATDTRSQGSFGVLMLTLLGLIWAPTAFILLAFAGLMQFRLMYGAMSSVFQTRKGGYVWRQVQPVLADIVGSLESSLGPASKFTPSLTHILLVGVILAIGLGTERVAAARRRQ
jgi:asparagine N-glycosylation enzyme membrane subunit Stt3